MKKVIYLNRALWVFHLNTGSCNGCDIEIIAALTPRYDVERFGIKLVGSPRHADVLLVTGPVTKWMEPVLRRVYEQTPDPKAVMVVGNCGNDAGVFYDSYAVLGSVDKVVPVDVYVPGCPPRPEAIIYGVVKAVQKLEDVRVVEEVEVCEPRPDERRIEVFVEYKPREPIPELPVDERITSFQEIFGPYTEEALKREAARCLQCPDPAPCVEACPAHVNAKRYIREAGEGRYWDALQTNLERLPFPASCGRVCPHPCEMECTRGNFDQPIAIRAIKRFVADRGMGERWYPEVRPNRSERIAVVGSGPAGLTVACKLALEGFPVTVFERSEAVGGMLMQSIPDYRLPPDVPPKEIEEIERLGVEIKKGMELGRDFTIQSLKDEGYTAIFLAIGAHRDLWMKIPGEELEGVHSAVDWLKEIKLNKERPSLKGKKVIVVGGGDVAMDAACTALRLGGDVTIVYRRAREQMPTTPEELHAAEKEGVQFSLLTNPVEILGEDGRVKGVRLIRMELGEPDESGRRRPIPIPGSEFEIPADFIIEAIGENPEGEALAEMGLKVNKWGGIEVNDRMETNLEGVFAAGDAVTGAATIIKAVAGALKAVESIKEYCEKVPVGAGRSESQAQEEPGQGSGPGSGSGSRSGSGP